ncbi:dolichol-phosphate mannosyltransferase [Streptomyces sp. SLBN-118]|uniref:glycosyltransferase n=1 Tax=Streptomyces sp. SLBN-118 TaxID=2768454 RepID=UPI001172AA80|nr:glycosyltransferase [Streptomyces sp. SLBN-118]TQK50245.1 dolichol-phosphate mannosyltransferase [Streptomyces sp. SLBN-118]
MSRKLDEHLTDAADSVDLSFVIPMYNEADIAREAVERAVKVGKNWGRSFEVLAVDDGSTDATPRILAELRATTPEFRWVQLRPNCGQPASSKAGMIAARGAMVCVLDADMQTPPEVVAQLVAALEQAGPEIAAVFGVTSTRKRDDPTRLLVGQAVFYFLETRFGRHPIPHGASSFFVMRQDVARRLGHLTFTKGNVGAIMAALGLDMDTVTYVKPKSYRDDSRLGLKGHVEEAVGSLALTGVLTRFGVTGGALAALAGVRSRSRWFRVAATAAAVASLGSVAAAELFNRRSLQVATTDLPIFEGEAAVAEQV